MINTEDSNLVGQGVINLDNEWVNYTWVARTKDFSITGAPTKIKIEDDLINPQLDLGGEDSLLEVSAEALITPLIEGVKAIFNEHEEGKRLTHCTRFRNEITRIQRESRGSIG